MYFEESGRIIFESEVETPFFVKNTIFCRFETIKKV